MNTQPKPTAEQQAEHIANLCRELYKTNEGPRLIAEMMEREFLNSLNLASRVYTDLIEELEEECVDVDRLRLEIRELEDTVDELEAEITKLESALHRE